MVQAKTNALRCSASGRRCPRIPVWKISLAVIFLLAALPLAAREKDGVQYGAGFIINVPFPESQVEQVVEEVSQNGIIRGTKEYNKDEYVSGATAASSTKVFKPWTQGGKVFYKVRLKAIDPRNFKDSGDVGTLAVRYIVQPQGAKNTILRIDAIFVEDFRRVSHASNGSVEGAEYKDIHDHLDAIDLMNAQTAEAEREKAEREKQAHLANLQASTASSATASQAVPAEEPPASSPQPVAASAVTGDPATDAAPQPSPQSTGLTLEARVHDLRQQVVRLVRAPGAPLKSAPFHTAGTLQSLPAGTEVLIVVTTPYWLGVETHEGQHGWIPRDELEQVP